MHTETFLFEPVNAGHYVIPLILVVLMVMALAIFVYRMCQSHPANPMMTDTGGIVPYLSIFGVLGFFGGMALVFWDLEKYRERGSALMGAGALALVSSIMVNAAKARRKRAAWPVVSAHCAERTLLKQSHEDSESWLWSLVCEFQYEGKTRRVKPKVRWSDAMRSEGSFQTEAKARKFIEHTISAHGGCQLRVNPENPEEAEFIE